MADDKHFYVRAIEGVDFKGVKGDHQVLLFERDDTHPNGEAFIAGPLPVQVGETNAVAILLRDKKIEKVSDAEAKAARVSSDPLAAERAALAAKTAELDALIAKAKQTR